MNRVPFFVLVAAVSSMCAQSFAHECCGCRRPSKFLPAAAPEESQEEQSSPLPLPALEEYIDQSSTPLSVAALEGFQGEWFNPLPPSIALRIKGKSWKADSPVPLDDLAYVMVSHWNKEGEIIEGELVCHKNLAQEFVEIFEELFAAHYPIERIALIDDYNADDNLSMKDNNSSAFCSRAVVGHPGVFSEHSYGGAIDINPLINPYVKGNIVLPKEGASFTDRSQTTPGLIKKGDACYEAFTKRGYEWGGDWKSLKDYQHFEKPRGEFLD